MTTVVLLTALDLEYQAVRQYLGQTRTQSHRAGTLFELGMLPEVPGTVALAVTGEGNVSAAILAERAISMFRPKALLCVGIAGGLQEDVALGDVVVATKIYAFHGGCERNDRFLARPRAWPASHELEQLARQVARAGVWMRPLAEGSALPFAGASRPPKVHFKPVASGEVVLTGTGASLPALLHDTYNDAAAIEMESAGVAQAAQLNRSLPVLCVRGISDRADPSKHAAETAGWQRIAAERAAALTVSIAGLVLRSQGPVKCHPGGRGTDYCELRRARLGGLITGNAGTVTVRRLNAR
jgi:adenosylhomocysteine nucleosidase